jgi:hypothetical protein
MLFVASQFITPDTATADYDGTIEFFHDPAFVSGSPTDTGVTTISRVPYKKTSNLFQMDGYAFSLSGSNITQIADADGNVLASNISIPLVPPYWPVVNAIAAAPSNPSPTPAPPSTPPNPPPRNPKLPSPEISVGAEDNPAGSPEVVFGGGPGNYLPLTQGTVNSELRNLQVNGIRPGGITGTAVHGGVVVRQRGTSQPTSDGPTIRDNSGGGPGVITLP